jgi:hypothetical protein
MIEGRPFLYQSKRGTVYHISAEGVKAVQSWPPKETAVAFIDGDRKNYEPNDILLHNSVQLIVASSPRGAFPRWTKQLGPGSFVTQLVVKLWSPEELFLTGLVLALLSTLG